MTAERRLAKVEASLSPTELVLRWLDEVHGFGDLDRHLAWLLDQPESAYPLIRLPREADQGVRSTMRGQPRAAIDEATHQAVREVVFRFELVLRLNVRIGEAVEREALVHLAIVGQLNVIGLERELGKRRRQRDHRVGYGSWLKVTGQWVSRLSATEGARREVEQRYLAGHTALFPAIATAWAERLRDAEQLLAMGARLAELDEPATLDTEAPPKPAAAEIDALAADLVDGARAAALLRLGEHEAAQKVVDRWLRPKLLLAVTASADSAGPTAAAR